MWKKEQEAASSSAGFVATKLECREGRGARGKTAARTEKPPTMEVGRQTAIGIVLINEELLFFGEIVSSERHHIRMLQSSNGGELRFKLTARSYDIFESLDSNDGSIFQNRFVCSSQ